ncbi:S8 family serine peptidase [Thiohalocapsa marina]|uniref:S8 family serine peptidase n=1 Tax=Thiohalocapsa marina TaxID=424902 RepID=UPI0036DD56C9
MFKRRIWACSRRTGHLSLVLALLAGVPASADNNFLDDLGPFGADPVEASGPPRELPATAEDRELASASAVSAAESARLTQLAGNAKLLNAQAVLQPLSRGAPETSVIVILEPSATARELAAQSHYALNRPAAFERAGAPVYYDLQNTHVRGLLRDTVSQAVDRFIVENERVGLVVTQRFSYQFGFAGRVDLDTLEYLLAHPDVLSIEEDGILYPHLAQGILLMQADGPSAAYDGSGISIAIVDTGIDTSHPMLGGGGNPIFNDKVIGGYDTGDGDADPRPNSSTGDPHGTACAGIAAGALGTIGDYIGGVAPGAKLYALKISAGDGGSATFSAMIAAWEWAITHQDDDPDNPIMVISTSFGGGRYASTCDSASSGMTTAAANAVAAGISIFVSSGNDGYCDSMGWPACISWVNSVGAVYDDNFGTYYPCVSSASCASKISTTQCTGYYVVDSTAPDKVTSYSNSADFLTLFAPANQAYTTDITGSGGYASGDYTSGFGGTSAACPYAAGAAAVLQAAARAKTGAFLSPAEVTSYLTTHGTIVTDSKITSVQKPRIDLQNAVDALPDGTPTVTVAATDATATEAGPTTCTFRFSRTGDTSAGLSVNYTVSGTATAGTDYQTLGTSISFSAGASTADKVLTPMQDALVEADETVVLALAEGSGYEVGSPSSATVTITSDDVQSYTVTATAGTGGEIDPLSRSVIHGDTTTFTVTPDSGYRIDTVIGCSGTLSGDTYTTGAITGVCAVSANFIEGCVDELVLEDQTESASISHVARQTIIAGPGYTIASTGDVTFAAGQQIRLRPGFSVQAGGQFRATIDSSACPP